MGAESNLHEKPSVDHSEHEHTGHDHGSEDDVGKTDMEKMAVALAEFSEEDPPRDVCVNVGATLQFVWLNGEKIYDSEKEWRGWRRRMQLSNVIFNRCSNCTAPGTMDCRTKPRRTAGTSAADATEIQQHGA